MLIPCSSKKPKQVAPIDHSKFHFFIWIYFPSIRYSKDVENICFTQHRAKPYSFASDNLIFSLTRRLLKQPDDRLLAKSLRTHANFVAIGAVSSLVLSIQLVLSLIGGDMDGIEADWTWRMAEKEEPPESFPFVRSGPFSPVLVDEAPP